MAVAAVWFRYSATYSPPACADRKLPTPYTRSPQRPPPANKMALRAPNKNLIRFRCFWKTTVIFEVLKNRGWTETNSELDWDFFWSDVGWMYEFFDHIHLADHQLTRKDLLIKNLKRMKKTLERDGQTVEAGKYNFFPQTYALPAEYGLFVEEFKRMSPVYEHLFLNHVAQKKLLIHLKYNEELLLHFWLLQLLLISPLFSQHGCFSLETM